MKLAAFTLLLAAWVSGSGAQSRKEAPQLVTGCVAHIPNMADKLVLASGDRCMLLAGSYDAAQISDHRITVTGTVTEAVDMAPLTLTIQRVREVAATCNKTCTLEPPGTRGIHGKERPGSEGGTPGLHAPGEQPSSQP